MNNQQNMTNSIHINKVSHFKLLTAKNIKEIPAMKWLIKGVFPERGLAAVYGPSRSGKSFLILDASFSIAEGREWFGRKTAKRKVVYVTLEGQSGLRQRIQAWEKYHDRPIPEGVMFIMQPFDLNTDMTELMKVVTPETVIVIDTLSRATPGIDENSSKEMGKVIQNVSILQQLSQSLVVLVAHTGKNSDAGLRGHSSLFAGLDAAMEVKRKGAKRSWHIEKVKDGIDGQAYHFKLHSVELGIDSDGDPVTSTVVTEDAEGACDEPDCLERLSDNADQALSCLDTSTTDGGCKLTDWRNSFYENQTGKSPDAKKKNFQRARRDLENAGFISITNDIVTRTYLAESMGV